ncbi:hypothetical protein SEA_CHARM_44 [Mycobacterium phage Charm]|nr:hypothetical protein SEA_CHARM_44 [Mycobacterium phage Charm]QGJ88324.1 hypothetical protein SEA_DREAMTEAM1_44 [Mycobacterium phage DreamTeam1]
MSDRFRAMVIEPRDGSLPIDVQGVNLRRKAIETMQGLGEVDENSVRYKAGTEESTVNDGDGGFISLWQHNAMAALFEANGKATKDRDSYMLLVDSRHRAHASVVRDPYA